ncbi:MAG: DUF488 domain-containing protein [Thermodesulfobacteriota bacterium]|nr:DUF488 domain-containing protein [Thermodesulfobacteriota bacterium]
MEKIFTIGHGNKRLEALIGILRTHEIQALADIRSYPRSKRNAQFNRENLEIELPRSGIAYGWFKGLGGHKKTGLGTSSPHGALRSEGFRNYADFMLSRGFKESVDALLPFVRTSNGCLMCAEVLPFKCHRWILSDYLTVHGAKVIHLVDAKKTRTHKLLECARSEGGNVFYDRLLPVQRPFDFGTP